MKAVVLTEDRRFGLVDARDPVPRPDEVLVRPHYCGICGTDLHAPELGDVFRPGVVLGHEFTGEVVGVGPEVDGWQVGQRVVANPNGHVCGSCRYCQDGRYNLCRIATVERPLGVRRDGGMAELVALHPAYLNELPSTLDTRRGAWAEPLAVAVRAVRTSTLRIGDRAAVIGGGPVGQLVLQVLRLAGASRVLMVEPSGFRGALARRLGADEVISPADLAGLGPGELPEVDHVMECSGHPGAVQTAVNLVAAGGSIRLVGMSPVPPSFDAVRVLQKEVTILGGFIYVSEFATAVDLLDRAAVDVDPLTSAVLPLDDYAAAFAALRRPEATMKVLVGAGAGP